jgi:hypothetical protein
MYRFETIHIYIQFNHLGYIIHSFIVYLPAALGGGEGVAATGASLTGSATFLGTLSSFFLNQVTKVFSLGFNSLDCSR